jgi:LuxR family maltose regulon positive regulatory protein
MQAAEQLAKDYDLAPRYATWVKSNLARLWITQGNLVRASSYVQQCGINTTGIFNHDHTQDAEFTYLSEPGYIVFLRLLLAHGEYDNALMLSERLFRIAEVTKRVGRMIEVLALQALAFQGKKDAVRAMEALESALLLAQPEGYVRVFLDEGKPMAKLLFLVKSQRSGQGYASELLSALGGEAGIELTPAQLLIEPLTLRELEVLKLIEAGCSNQEIAAELVISIPTVKRHISNIYTKLGTSSRTQAVLRGKELNLFQ